MISFFRKIRQKLLAKNQITRYLLYAFGEIALVMIGILLALQVNDWNENKIAQANTSIYVDNLIDDLKKDISTFDFEIENTKTKFYSCKEINKVIREGFPIKDTSEFIIQLQLVGRLSLPNISNNTFNDLISSGNLKLIKDRQSIAAIREYYNYQVNYWFTDYRNQLVNGYLPIAVNAIPMHLHEEILSTESNGAYQQSLNLENDASLIKHTLTRITKSDVKEVMDALVGNEEFDFHLKRITRSHLVHINTLSGRKKSAESLLENLEAWKIENN